MPNKTQSGTLKMFSRGYSINSQPVRFLYASEVFCQNFSTKQNTILFKKHTLFELIISENKTTENR